MKARSASMSMAVDSNDLQSALAEKGLAISISPEKGRCLIAKRSFTRGEIVLLQDPYVSVLDSASVNKRCDVCFRLCTNLKRCSVCKTTWYCGGTCQRNGWRLHQHECKAITSLKEEKQQTPTPSLQLMLRLLIKRKLQNAGFSCNAHTICDSELRPMGTGLYPVISIINHSCFPNAVLLFEGRQAVVRAVEPIREGSELTVSYIEIAASTASRKKSLKEQYFFDCKCLRCLKVDTPDGLHEDAILEGFRCSSDHCEGFLLHDPDDAQSLVCQLCGCGRNEEETKKQARKVDKLGKEASKLLSSGNYSEARSLYEQIQQLQTQLWHPYSVILLRTGDTLLKICMELYDWKQALKYCRLTIPAYERAYPTCHPMMGLQYYACGKLEWFLENTLEALNFFEKAAKILTVTHGRNSEFLTQLFDRIQEAHAEAAHLRPRYDDNED
uniref:MYND-type domain-containing protein n=1 Tax=Picea sitchensis TaxID=3332 RepID=B8LLP0_PICSI|nr:unknown [Picea sitchensis]